MKSGAPNFTENNSVKEVYKASLFKNIFASRKALLAGYPAVKKGLALPDASLSFGTVNYTFKTTETADKVVAKSNGDEAQARYKKETGKWDVSLKKKCLDGQWLFKYEERGTGSPVYLVGGNLNPGKGFATFDAKVNLVSGVVKKSCFLDMKDFLPGLKIAGDAKANLLDFSLSKWNVGVAHGHKFGMTAVALNNSKHITFNHCYSLNKNTNLAVELVKSLGNEEVSCPLTLGIGQKLDDDHTLKVRVNNAGQLNAKLEKKFNQNLTVEMATCVNVNDQKTIVAVPAFGFKIVTKC